MLGIFAIYLSSCCQTAPESSQNKNVRVRKISTHRAETNNIIGKQPQYTVPVNFICQLLGNFK